jgi:hypothetical protein
MCKGVEFDHVKPNLVHEFFCIQGIRITPLKQFENVLPIGMYKKYERKFKKTWGSFTLEAFF